MSNSLGSVFLQNLKILSSWSLSLNYKNCTSAVSFYYKLKMTDYTVFIKALNKHTQKMFWMNSEFTSKKVGTFQLL